MSNLKLPSGQRTRRARRVTGRALLLLHRETQPVHRWLSAGIFSAAPRARAAGPRRAGPGGAGPVRPRLDLWCGVDQGSEACWKWMYAGAVNLQPSVFQAQLAIQAAFRVK